MSYKPSEFLIVTTFEVIEKLSDEGYFKPGCTTKLPPIMTDVRLSKHEGCQLLNKLNAQLREHSHLRSLQVISVRTDERCIDARSKHVTGVMDVCVNRQDV